MASVKNDFIDPKSGAEVPLPCPDWPYLPGLTLWPPPPLSLVFRVRSLEKYYNALAWLTDYRYI